MAEQTNIPDPKVVVGIASGVFGGWVALEGAVMQSMGELLIAAAFILGGWLLRKRGLATMKSAGRPRWLRFCVVALPVFLGAYVLGYFALMDRHNPTSPVGGQTRFDSSLRWAPHEWVTRAVPPYETPWRTSTTWNILYQPMDRLWFHFFPRSKEEIEALRTTGYYR